MRLLFIAISVFLLSFRIICKDNLIFDWGAENSSHIDSGGLWSSGQLGPNREGCSWMQCNWKRIEALEWHVGQSPKANRSMAHSRAHKRWKGRLTIWSLWIFLKPKQSGYSFEIFIAFWMSETSKFSLYLRYKQDGTWSLDHFPKSCRKDAFRVLCRILVGGRLTRKMGVVHQNFISFVSMVTWREALLQGVWRAAARPRTDEF